MLTSRADDSSEAMAGDRTAPRLRISIGRFAFMQVFFEMGTKTVDKIGLQTPTQPDRVE